MEQGKNSQMHFQILGNLTYDSEKDRFSGVQDDWLSIWKNKSLSHTIYNKFIPVLQAYPNAELAVRAKMLITGETVNYLQIHNKKREMLIL